jgi:S1-C subfamily serine protease
MFAAVLLAAAPLAAQTYTNPWAPPADSINRAIRIWKQAVKEHPRDAGLHVKLAEALSAKDIFPGEEALSHYRTALSLDSSSYAAAFAIGQAAWFASRNAEAVKLLRHAVQLAPDSTAAYRILGHVLAADGRYLEAIQVFDTVLARVPDGVDIYREKVDALVATRQFESARAVANSLIERSLGKGEGYWALGGVEEATGNTAAAIDAYKKAILAGGGSFRTYGDLNSAVILFRRLGRISELGGTLMMRAAADSTDYPVTYVLANLFNETGRPEAALPRWRTLVATNPNSASYQFGLGSALFALERFEEALRAFSQAATLDTTLGPAFFNVGASAARLHRYEEAFEGYRRAALLQPRDAETWLRLGSASVQLKRPAAAVAYFERGLRENPAIFDSLTFSRSQWEAALAVAGRQPPATDAMLGRALARGKPTSGAAPAKAKSGSPRRTNVLSATGSGAVVGSGDIVLTNAHVVSHCSRVSVRSPDGKEADAKKQAVDQRNDLALLRTPGVVGTPLSLRLQPAVRTGEDVIVLGYPLHGVLADQLNVTTGTISALAGLGNDARLYQITAPVQPGNSGGPLLDASGALLGLVVSKLDAGKVYQLTGDVPQNINFAIKGPILATFLEANGSKAGSARSGLGPTRRSVSDIAEAAKPSTVLVQCYE